LPDFARRVDQVLGVRETVNFTSDRGRTKMRLVTPLVPFGKLSGRP
jgi:hypothetical protein